MSWDPTQRWVTIEEAARSVARPPSTIRRWISEHRITPVAKLGRRTLLLEADVLQVDGDTTRQQRGTVRPT